MASAVTSQNEQMVKIPPSPSKPGVCTLCPVAQDQAVLGQLVGDGQYGRFDALVVGGAGIP
jgi:hypothetical protein